MTSDARKEISGYAHEAEREPLEQLLRGGTYRDLQGARAWILLKAAEGWTDERVAERWRLDGRPLNAPESAL